MRSSPALHTYFHSSISFFFRFFLSFVAFHCTTTTLFRVLHIQMYTTIFMGAYTLNFEWAEMNRTAYNDSSNSNQIVGDRVKKETKNEVKQMLSEWCWSANHSSVIYFLSRFLSILFFFVVVGIVIVSSLAFGVNDGGEHVRDISCMHIMYYCSGMYTLYFVLHSTLYSTHIFDIRGYNKRRIVGCCCCVVLCTAFGILANEPCNLLTNNIHHSHTKQQSSYVVQWRSKMWINSWHITGSKPSL